MRWALRKLELLPGRLLERRRTPAHEERAEHLGGAREVQQVPRVHMAKDLKITPHGQRMHACIHRHCTVVVRDER